MVPVGAQADTHIYTTTPVDVQQTANNPCIIGDPSCDTNTKHTFPFPYTVASGPCSGGNCDFTSPLYQAGSGGPSPPNNIPSSVHFGGGTKVGTRPGP